MISAFGVETIGKHYLGRHDEAHSNHTRLEHKDLKSTRRATKRAYVGGRTAVESAASIAQQKAHPVLHLAEGVSNDMRERRNHSRVHTSAELAGLRAGEEWEGSPRGRAAYGLVDRARADWNPRYAKRRAFRMAEDAKTLQARRAADRAVSKSAATMGFKAGSAVRSVGSAIKANPVGVGGGLLAGGAAVGGLGLIGHDAHKVLAQQLATRKKLIIPSTDDTIAKSAFGVEHVAVSKADRKTKARS